MTAVAFEISYPDRINHICRELAQSGGRAYVVGGFVRDAVLGVSVPMDFDLEVYGLPGEKLERCLRKIGRVQLVGKAFGVYKLADRDLDIDIALPRREFKSGKGHRGFKTQESPDLDLEVACSRRDLTINAILHDPLSQELVDPLDGLEDLRRGRLRHCSEAFAEDPLRALRVAQFAARFRFDVAEETLELCRTLDLDELPQERVFGEIRKILLDSMAPSWGFKILEKIGIERTLVELGPLIHDDPQGWRKTLLALDQGAWRRHLPDRPLTLMLALLVARIDPRDRDRHRHVEADRLLERLTREQKIIDEVRTLLDHRGRLAEIDPSSWPRAEVDTALRKLSTTVPLISLIECERAIRLGREESPDRAPELESLRDRVNALGLQSGPPSPFVHGRDLMAMGLRPGPEIGSLLRRVFERQLEGAFSHRDDALEWIRTQVDQPGEILDPEDPG